MVMNCGRGSEIGVTRFQDLNLKRIEEDYGLVYETMEQYVNRTKTEGKFQLDKYIDFKNVFQSWLISKPSWRNGLFQNRLEKIVYFKDDFELCLTLTIL